MITFIIQARLGSTRLPNKILLPFHKKENIISTIVEKLKRLQNSEVIIATTNNDRDLPLVNVAESLQVKIYRGSESDVLSRFIGAAHQYDAKKIIRVCSDNPFLDEGSIRTLIEEGIYSNADYVSFLVNGKPSIKTHFGFWAEYVTLEALEKVQEVTQESIYHEHVTNYIYTHPQDFKIKWLETPGVLQGREDIRLTIDTQQDFIDAQETYKHYVDNNMTIEDLVGYLDQNPSLLEKMKKEIKLNSK